MAYLYTGPGQFLDDTGRPLSGGLLYFYDVGTLNAFTTYTTSALSVANANPLVLDGDGRIPACYFEGTARLIVKNADDEEIQDIAVVGDQAVDQNFGVWDSATTYASGDIVVGSDSAFYESLQNANQGNDPTSSATYWAQIKFLGVYNANKSYSLGDMIVSGTIPYVSLANGNSGNTPASTPASWKPLITSTDAATLTNKVITDIDYDMSTGTDLDPANGYFQRKTLTENTTFTESLENGSSILLKIAAGATYTVAWPTMTWATAAAPTLTADDLVALFQLNDVVYGIYLGTIA